MLLIHGARAVLATPSGSRLLIGSAPGLRLERERGHNHTAVALASKLARIAWAVWKTRHGYTLTPATPA